MFYYPNRFLALVLLVTTVMATPTYAQPHVDHVSNKQLNTRVAESAEVQQKVNDLTIVMDILNMGASFQVGLAQGLQKRTQPNGEQTEIITQVLAASPQTVDHAIAIVYAPYFQHHETQQLVAFYQSEVGQQLLSLQRSNTADPFSQLDQDAQRQVLQVMRSDAGQTLTRLSRDQRMWKRVVEQLIGANVWLYDEVGRPSSHAL